MNPTTRRLLLLTLLICSSGALAQADLSKLAGAPWYQVEVILFTYTQPSGEESWRSDLQLGYPKHWVQLQDPVAVEAQRRNATIPEAKSFPGSTPAGSTNLEIATAPPAPIDLSKDPFFFLPKEQRQLTKAAQNFTWSKEIKVLFHEAWRQPMGQPGSSPAILIAAGNTFGSHKELEGSIMLSAGRYLELSTNLWLTSFARNYGQDKGAWPTLPMAPTPAPVVNALPPSAVTTSPEWELSQAMQAETETDNSQSTEVIATEEPFIPERIVSFKQDRRMKNGEIHYLDHPLMGMLILVQPYRPEQGNSATSP